MIQAASAQDLLKYAPQNEALLRILSTAEVYGFDRPFCRFFVGDDSVFSVMDGIATVDFGTDAEEVMLYLTMSPDVRAVRTDAASALALASRWHTTAKTGAVMRASEKIVQCGEAKLCAPSSVYDPLMSVFGKDIPPFDVWYADVHYRYRHDRFCASAVFCEDRAVSCAMTTAACEEAVLIGGVATLPSFRGRGYASACVTAIAAKYGDGGKQVWISPKNDAAEKLYRELGFAVIGQWGIVEKI